MAQRRRRGRRSESGLAFATRHKRVRHVRNKFESTNQPGRNYRAKREEESGIAKRGDYVRTSPFKDLTASV